MTSNLKNELRDQIDGQSDEYKEVIIQNETQKFIEIFDRVFSSNDNTVEDIDNVDGLVEDILNAIVSRIKALIKQKFIKEVILEQQEEEEEEEEIEEEEEEEIEEEEEEKEQQQ